MKYSNQSAMKTMLASFLLAAICFPLSAFYSPSDKAIQKLFDKKDFPKIRESVEKRIEKYPNDPLAFYWRALYFFHNENPNRSLKDANTAVLRCKELFPNVTDEKIKKKMLESPIREVNINELHQNINREGFEAAKKTDTEAAYEGFMKEFFGHGFEKELIPLMQKAAYRAASIQNTWQAYKAFFDKYPDAQDTEQAKANYEILLFQEKTKDGSINAYANFLKENPKTPYRKIIEDKIFDLATTVPDESVFRDFIKKYPDNPNVKRAWDWIFFLYADKDLLQKKYPDFPDKNRLKNFKAVQDVRFFPFAEKNKIGFMDDTGNICIKPFLDSIPEDFKCEFWQDLYMPIPAKNGKFGLTDKLGNMIFETKYDMVEDLSAACVKILQNDKYAIFCKNGEQLTDYLYDDIFAVGETCAAVKIKSKFKFITLKGADLEIPEFDDIEVFNGIIGKATKGGKSQFFTAEDLLDIALKKKKYAPSSVSVDDLTPINKTYYIITAGSKVGLVTTKGKLIHEPKGKTFLNNDKIAAIEEAGKWYFYDENGKKIAESNFTKVDFSENKIFVKHSGKFGIFAPEVENACNCNWDTVARVSNGFWYVEGGQKKLQTDDGKAYNLTEYLNFSTKKIGNAVFVLVENKAGKKNALSPAGVLISKTWYEDVEPMNDGYIRIKLNKRFGLIDAAGKTVIQPIYQGLIEIKQGCFSVLLNKKFGLFVPSRKIEMKPIYDVTVQPYEGNEDYFCAKKGKFGIINSQGRNILPFQYERIMAWTNEKALVQQEKTWKIIDILAPAEAVDSFEDYTQIKSAPDELMFITYNPTGFGLISNKKGRLMTDEYSQIINLGTYEEPFYFAERYMSQANFYVVLYFDKNGKVVRRQTLTEEEYAKVGCTE
jgi:hypothetical protein